MNERIRQLAIEATEYVDVPMPHEIYNLGEGVFRKILTFNQEKFAELIVRECLDIVNRKEYSYHEADPLWETAQLIKERFGVEE
jgi:hypothetical protein